MGTYRNIRIVLTVVAALSLLIVQPAHAEQITHDYLYYADCTLTTTAGEVWTECGDPNVYSWGTTSNWRKNTWFGCVTEHGGSSCEYWTGSVWVQINCNGNNC
jgi:hypothetical protein